MKKVIAIGAILLASFVPSMGTVSAETDCSHHRTIVSSAVRRPVEWRNTSGAMPIVYLPVGAPSDWCAAPHAIFVLSDINGSVTRIQ
jgi:hypothetical protein